MSKFLAANQHSDLGEVVPPVDESRMAVQASIALGLDFGPGMLFAKEIWNLFGTPVHPTSYSGHFLMIVSFGRATFRLTEDSVGLAMEAALGGFCGELKVSLLKNRVFSFTVYIKLVGFHILSRRFYECFHFKCHFHLWSHGGPNWQREFVHWKKQCEEEWTLISKAPKFVPGSKGSANKQLRFAKNLQYKVCKGYVPPHSSTPQQQGITSNGAGGMKVSSSEQPTCSRSELAGSKDSNFLG